MFNFKSNVTKLTPFICRLTKCHRKIFVKMESVQDCCLIAEDGSRFLVNRAILCASSKYFTKLFCGYFSIQRNEIEVPGITGSSMKNLLDFTYSANVSINDSNICELLMAADYLIMDDLLARCRDFIVENISLKNSISLVNQTCVLSHLKMDSFCVHFVRANLKAVLNETDEFLKLSLAAWIEIIKDSFWNATEIKMIWGSIMKWLTTDADRLISVFDLVQCLISVCNSRNREFLSAVFENPIISQNPECYEIIKSLNAICTNGSAQRLQKQPVFFVFLPSADASNSLRFFTGSLVHRLLIRRRYLSFLCPDAVFVIENVLYMFNTLIDELYAIDLRNFYQRKVASTQIFRTGYSVAQLGHQLFLLGGNGSRSSDVCIYDTESELWIDKPLMPHTLRSSSVETLDGKIYLFCIKEPPVSHGGLQGFVYEPLAEAWSRVHAPNVFREDFLLTAHCGLLFAVGGSIGNKFLKTVEKYNPVWDQWEQIADLPHEYFEPKAIAVGSLLIVHENLNGRQSRIKMKSPAYLDPMTNSCVALRFDSFLRMLGKFSICVVEICSVI